MKNYFRNYFCLFTIICIFGGCARHSLIEEENLLFEQQRVTPLVKIKEFVDKRPNEEKQGLTKKTRKILSFASKDSDFEEKISTAITKKLKNKLAKKGLYSDIKKAKDSKYLLEGEIKHFQTVMRLPNTTFVPYLGTAATVITKDEFNIAVSIKATLKNIESNEILFNQTFNVSDDLALPTGLLNLARLGRGLNYRFKVLDKALDDVLEQITQKIQTSIAANIENEKENSCETTEVIEKTAEEKIAIK